MPTLCTAVDNCVTYCTCSPGWNGDDCSMADLLVPAAITAQSAALDALVCGCV